MVTAATWFHAMVKGMSRAQGRSAVAAAAYRTGERYLCEREGREFDYSRRRREGLVASFTLLPEGANPALGSTEALWNAAEAAEKRKDAKVARELELALPHRASPEARLEIAQRAARALVERYGVGVTVAIHAPPPKASGQEATNWHAHIMFTTRAATADGLGEKTRILDQAKTSGKEVRWLRERCAWIINDTLEKAGSEERVTHKSLLDQGIIDRLPQWHLGPSAEEVARRGELSEEERLAKYRATQDQQARRFLDELVAELAGVDAELAAEEERLLDAQYGPLEDAGEDRSERAAEIEAIVQEIAGTPAEAKPEPQERPRDPDPDKARVKDGAAPHVEQIASGEGLHDIHEDGQTWWQRTASQARLRARQFRDMAWKSWEYTKATWNDLTRAVRDKQDPRDFGSDRDQDRER